MDSNRSGTYIQQPLGYASFMPWPLPPKEPIEYDHEIISRLAKAERSLGLLDGATATLPNPDLFVFVTIRKEAVLSSQIEGTQSSLADLLEAESKIRRPNNPQDVEEVSRYVSALNEGIDQISKRRLSVSLIKELHKILMDDPSSGDLRTIQNWIGRIGSDIHSATYIPPPPGEVPRLMDELDDFIHRSDDTPILIKIGLIHAQFESIHPFLDGNGRLGRLLVSLLLKQYGLLKYPLLYLSSYFQQNRTEYYSKLQNTREKGQWESWLKFFLQGVSEVAAEAGSNSTRVLKLREEHRELLRVELGKGASSALELLDTLFYRPYVTVLSVSEIVGLTFAGANKLVAKCVDLGILQPTAEKARNRSFRYSQFLDIFEPS